jgi:hypothetical protein
MDSFHGMDFVCEVRGGHFHVGYMVLSGGLQCCLK